MSMQMDYVPELASSAIAPTANRNSKPVKQLVIKGLKDVPKVPDDYKQKTWEKLKLAVEAIYSQRTIENSLEELYKASENLCHGEMQEMMYRGLCDMCSSNVEKQLRHIQSKTGPYISFLQTINESWTNFTNQVLMIRSIFLYLDRTYVLHIPSLRSIWDMSLETFKKLIFNNVSIQKRLIESILSEIKRERQKESVDRSLLKSLVRMFIDLQTYEYLETPLVESSKQFYQELGNTLIQQVESATFSEEVEKRIKEESERVAFYLDASSKRSLILSIEINMFKPHYPTVIERGFDQLMDENRIEDLSRIYSLFSRVESLASLKTSFGAYVKKRGAEIVMTGGERDNTMVQEMLDFKDKIDKIVTNSFNNDSQFVYCLKDSFESFVNMRHNKPAEFIAKYLDALLKGGNKALSDDELDLLLDKVMILFRFIQDKDMFEAFYKKDLAKRLLLSKSASVDAEKSMLSKLKTECGSEFTNKLEGMFKDIQISKDIMSSFNSNARFKKMLKGFELYVNVLTAGFWPTYPQMEVNLPQEMVNCQEVFKSFYLTQHHGKKLFWQSSLGTCIVKANFPQGRKELSVSLFQAIVLLIFNLSKDNVPFSAIKEQTNIEESELKRTLQSLACGKIRVLIKTPKGKDIDDDDTFSFNEEFKHQLTRIKVNQIQLKETVEEQKDTEDRVFLDRQYQIDAAIVRIMKMRKKLGHNLLISELYQQLKFTSKPADLKKRIESLIDREYLERDKANPNEYIYLA